MDPEESGVTDTETRSLKPAEKTYRISDGGGLYIEVNPKGGKAWRQTYRLNGKPRAHPHGLFPAVKLGQARLLREQLKEQVRNGEDPRRARAELEAPAASPRDDDRM